MAITRRQRRLRKSSRCGRKIKSNGKSRCGRKIKSNGKRRHRRTKKVSGGGSGRKSTIKIHKPNAAERERLRLSQIPQRRIERQSIILRKRTQINLLPLTFDLAHCCDLLRRGDH